LVVCAVWSVAPDAAHATFTTFESGQVRPLAMSPDGTRLFAVNTPDDYLEIFAIDGSGNLTHTGSVPVGLEPVAVAARSNTEVWVVNHLSDSVSIVDLSTSPPRVVRTLLVGDEPRDIVFAGTGGNRAFITTAHRGQNRPGSGQDTTIGIGGDPQLTTEGIGRADVYVFDATNLGATLTGTPVSVLTLFCDTPRALAVSPDGNTVYAAAFESGNETTTANGGVVCDGGAGASPCNIGGTTYPGGLPAPNTNFQGTAQPEVGLIIRRNPSTNRFEDELGRNWNPAVRFNLPDRDVFAINANTLAAPTPFAHVGTILFNMAVNPVSGKLYVSNTEAHNESRFEGPGTFAGHSVRGHLHEARITVISGSTVTPRHLNKHINYSVVPSPVGVKDNSLAIPTGLAVTGDGTRLYVAAFGSSTVGIFDTSELENDTFTPSGLDHIPVSGGGPSGLVLNEADGRLYVFTRFDNAVSVIDTSSENEIAHLPVHNPEPASVRNGRPILYDAMLSSSNGEASCASCHVFGDFDSLAWDLGNPDDVPLVNNNPFTVGGGASFNPLKGPMTTQSLRGMANHGPMHWRGDRSGANNPGGNALDENAAFNRFIVAFDGLLGRGGPITNAQMQAFADFILQVTYPPNPIRALNNSLTASQQAGHDVFFGPVTDSVLDCNGCHELNPAAGFFGGNGGSSIEGETQEFKVPHLRNLYQKVGMFGLPITPGVDGTGVNTGDQVRGFGFLHDGSIDTIFRFHSASVFSIDDTQQLALEQFMLAFDSNLAPIVGQQITLTSTNSGVVGGRINLLIARAALNECELTVKGVLAGEPRGWLRLANGTFTSDDANDAALTDAQLRAQAATPGQERTYMCVPGGSGTRVGIDRDEDGFRDHDELQAGSDPADPLSIPGGGSTTTTTTTTTVTTTSSTLVANTLIPTKRLTIRDRTVPTPDPNRRRFSFRAVTTEAAPMNQIVPPVQGSLNDPTLSGAILFIYNSAGETTDVFLTGLNGAWSSPSPGVYQYKNSAVGAPIQRVLMKKNQLTIKGGKSGFTYTLNEPQQGSVAVILGMGSQTWCASALAKRSGHPPSTAKNDHIDKFIGQPNALPATCPAMPPF
jgi:YVTN family beta-propeller protein